LTYPTCGAGAILRAGWRANRWQRADIFGEKQIERHGERRPAKAHGRSLRARETADDVMMTR